MSRNFMPCGSLSERQTRKMVKNMETENKKRSLQLDKLYEEILIDLDLPVDLTPAQATEKMKVVMLSNGKEREILGIDMKKGVVIFVGGGSMNLFTVKEFHGMEPQIKFVLKECGQDIGEQVLVVED
jgi:hypothetical protein